MKNKELTPFCDNVPVFEHILSLYRIKQKKTCYVCKKTYPVSEYNKGKGKCKPCTKEYNRKYHAAKNIPKPRKVSKYEAKQHRIITGIKRNPILYWDCLEYEN